MREAGIDLKRSLVLALALGVTACGSSAASPTDSASASSSSAAANATGGTGSGGTSSDSSSSASSTTTTTASSASGSTGSSSDSGSSGSDSGTSSSGSVTATSTSGTSGTSGGSSGTSGSLALSGTITFDAVKSTLNGLDYTAITQKPVRHAVVRLLDSGGVELASSSTDEAGAYRFSWSGTSQVKVRVEASLAGPVARIVDNTASGALYALDSAMVDASTQSSLSFNAASGWGGTSYTGTRASAPFSLLDAVWSEISTFTSVRTVAFPDLNINWSINNVPQSGDKTQGFIGTSHWDRTALYILGKENVDTDEFDTHIMCHEWGHYFESKLSRSDSPGGSHSDGEIKDPRLAFGEGWGNALSAMALYPDTVYTDTTGPQQGQGFGFDLNEDVADNNNPGWWSEHSVQLILFDLFEPANGTPDAVGLGMGPLYDVMVNGEKSTSALTSIFSFVSALKAANPGSGPAIDAVTALHNIDAIQDAFGTGETHGAGLSGVPPVYGDLTLNAGAPTPINLVGDLLPNTLGDNRYFKFVGSGNQVTLTANSADDVAINLFYNGVQTRVDNTVSGQEQLVVPATVSGDTYVVVITGFNTDAGVPYTATLTATSP